MRQPLHPTVEAVRRAEKRYKASVEREADDKAALIEARNERDKAMLEDADPNAAAVGRRFDVSATWVKRLRKKRDEERG